MSKNTAFPDCPETLAYEAFVRVISGDPGLQAAGVTIRTWDGSSMDLLAPTEAEMPQIQLVTGGDGTGWFSESEHRSDLAIGVVAYVASTCAADLLNLWGLFRTAMFPPMGSARRLAVDAVMSPLVVNARLSRQAVDVKPAASGERVLVAAGAVSLRINVNT
jgi:hypothetical protein